MEEARSRALIDEIYDAFRSVTREGGVSWSEAFVIDQYGTSEERAIARRRDGDQSWTELVDSDWRESPGVGGFGFLDPIGSRYYLPAAMVRGIRTGESQLDFQLTLVAPDERETWSARHVLAHELRLEGTAQARFEESQWSLLNERQRNCVKGFISLMVSHAREHENWLEEENWQGVRDSGWDEL